MDWQDKLRTLIEAYDQGHALVKEQLSCYAPLLPNQVDAVLHHLTEEFGIDSTLLDPLGRLYKVTDGVIMAGGSFRIPGLIEERNDPRRANGGLRTLQRCNFDSLEIMQNIVQHAELQGTIRLIFGWDEAGDYYCLYDDGMVLRIGYSTTEPVVIASSLDTFLDDVCLGFGFVRYYRPSNDDPWLIVLKVFGFV